MTRPAITHYVQLREDTIYEIAPCFVTNRPVLCRNYFINNSDVQRDVGFLINKILRKIEIDVQSIDGVVSLGGWNSDYLTLLAGMHLEQMSGKKGKVIYPARVDQLPAIADCIPSISTEETYLIVADHLLRGEAGAKSIKLLRKKKAIPLAVGALIDRRTNHRPIEGVQVVSLLDLSGYSADLSRGESLSISGSYMNRSLRIV